MIYCPTVTLKQMWLNMNFNSFSLHRQVEEFLIGLSSRCKILIIDCNDIKTKLFQTRNIKVRLLTSLSLYMPFFLLMLIANFKNVLSIFWGLNIKVQHNIIFPCWTFLNPRKGHKNCKLAKLVFLWGQLSVKAPGKKCKMAFLLYWNLFRNTTKC